MAALQEARVLVGVAGVCSLLAIAACLLVVPSLLSELNDVHNMVTDAVQTFRVDTDIAWNNVMEVRMAVAPPTRSPSEELKSIFRPKRDSGYAEAQALPAFCMCEPPKPKCKPGPAGPPGPPGAP
ncbi:nematode cuticle collagen domain protein, partial [Ancylostoma duodenale]